MPASVRTSGSVCCDKAVTDRREPQDRLPTGAALFAGSHHQRAGRADRHHPYRVMPAASPKGPDEADAPNGELGGNATTFSGNTPAPDDTAAAPTVDPANGGLY